MRHHRQARERPRILADEDEHRTEPRLLRLADERERARRVVGQHRRRAVAERGGDRPLAARLDLQGLERKPFALLGERTRGGRDALPLGERLLERGESLTGQGEAGLHVLVLAHGGACGSVGLVGGPAHLGRRRPCRAAPRLLELPAQLPDQPLRRLLAHAEPLRRPAQGEQRVAPAAG